MMFLDKNSQRIKISLKGSLWLLFLFLTACETDLPENTWRGMTMGTAYQIKVTGKELDQNTYDDLQTKMSSLLEEVNRQMSTYDSQSEISRFNTLRDTIGFNISPGFGRVVRTALKVYRESSGAFDITVGPLVDLWGFGAASVEFQIPTDQSIQSVLGRIGSDKLRVIADTLLIKSIPDLEIDLGAIAKGHGVDVIAAFLQQEGYENYLVEIGGEVAARGINSKHDSWKIGIDQPDYGNLPGQGVAKILALRNAAVATSGDYRNFFEQGGKIYSHTINPKTGRPVTHTLASVTVIAASCLEADALATATIVLGTEQGLQFIEQIPGAEAMLISRVGKDKFTESQTSGFGRYIVENK